MMPTATERITGEKSSARHTAPEVAARPISVWRELMNATTLCTLTVVLFSLIFPPYELWPLSFICLVPWTLSVCTTSRPWLIYWVGFLAGWCFFLFNLLWMLPVTGIGYVALAFYIGLYWPLSAWAVRTGRRHRISPIWTLPVTWVACEFLRGWAMSGFPWLFIGHAFYKQLWLIQISDIVGAYGVTFLATMCSGVIVEALLRRRKDAHLASSRQFLAGLVTFGGVLAASIAYGAYQLRAAQFTPGPRIAVIQEDFPLRSTPPYGDPQEVIFARYVALAGTAASQERPDIVAFPETAWNATQNIGFLEVEHQAADNIRASSWSFGKRCHDAISALARGDYASVNELLAEWERVLREYVRRDPRSSLPRDLPRLPAGGHPTTIVLGAVSVEVNPQSAYPGTEKFNSALVYDSDGTQRRVRYDKTHLVPFGEFVPFRNGRLHRLYLFLNSLSPFSGKDGSYEYSLSAGKEMTVFDLPTANRTYRFGTPICYEDVMPYVIRKYVWDGPRRRVDFLLNVSNDGWFVHSPELPQHLAICVFRAIENRVGIARAVNTGISGFVDPNGRTYSLVEKDGRTFGPGITGFRVDHVQIDDRGSMYGRYGDWFAVLCVALAGMLWFDAVGTRWVVASWRRLFGRTAQGGA